MKILPLTSHGGLPMGHLQASRKPALTLSGLPWTSKLMLPQGPLTQLASAWAGGAGDMMAVMGASLLDARNRAWMEMLAPQLARGGVFAAFGAMHLVGDAGVIELLRARGFTVTRLDG